MHSRSIFNNTRGTRLVNTAGVENETVFIIRVYLLSDQRKVPTGGKNIEKWKYLQSPCIRQYFI
jgi:hypothetical protein